MATSYTINKMKDDIEQLRTENATLRQQRDELLEALEDVSDFLNFAWDDIEMNEYSFNLLEDAICKSQQAIAKAKGENE